MEPILWCDIETTGLSEDALILEVGLIATDSSLHEQGRISVVVGWPDVDPFLSVHVREMHTANDLLDEVKNSSLSLADAEQKLMQFASQFERRPMGGSSVHTDRTWLRRSMPRLERMFHYRNFDVSTLRTFFKTTEGVKPVKHRAIGDLVHDIGVTADLHRQVFGGGQNDSA